MHALILVVSESAYKDMQSKIKHMGSEQFNQQLSAEINLTNPSIGLTPGTRITIVREGTFKIMYMADAVTAMPSLNTDRSYN